MHERLCHTSIVTASSKKQKADFSDINLNYKNNHKNLCNVDQYGQKILPKNISDKFQFI